MAGNSGLDALCRDIRQCRICEAHLPLGPRPVFSVSATATVLVVGQAPGIRVHETGIPFNDPSGDRLREWMGVDRETFYDPGRIALVPMGFCYPGTGNSGDLPPRRECARTWRESLLEHLDAVRLTLVIGQYSMSWHLGPARRKNLTETVRAWQGIRPGDHSPAAPEPAQQYLAQAQSLVQ